MSIIKVRNLTKKYFLGKSNLTSFINENFRKEKVNILTAIDNINFDIYENDKVALIGKNGSGKSTLLKLMSRVTFPTEGKITVEGKISSILEAGAGFHPELTGRENIFLTGSILGMSKKSIFNKCEDIINFSELKNQIDTPVKRYSTGMSIKLAFAICSFLDGDILIFDEILAVADDEFRKKATKKILENVNKKKKTLIMVSHQKQNLLDVCNKAILLDKGKILNIGTPEVILNEYSNLIQKNG